MQQNVSGSARFAKIKTTYRGRKNHNLENVACDTVKYTVGSPRLIVSIGMGKSIKMQRVILGIKSASVFSKLTKSIDYIICNKKIWSI